MCRDFVIFFFFFFFFLKSNRGTERAPLNFIQKAPRGPLQGRKALSRGLRYQAEGGFSLFLRTEVSVCTIRVRFLRIVASVQSGTRSTLRLTSPRLVIWSTNWLYLRDRLGLWFWACMNYRTIFSPWTGLRQTQRHSSTSYSPIHDQTFHLATQHLHTMLFHVPCSMPT